MKYPFGDYETAESFIEAIESNPNGHYPIGTSMFWHSGVHIFCDSQKEFEPLISGKVVCYRISEDYKHVELPASLDKEELEGKWSDYKEFYDKEGRIRADCKNETYPISDCFILLEHTISINRRDFTFHTLYMNLAPACDNKNYKKPLTMDGAIHGNAINPAEESFFVDNIGLPAKDKKQIYFDLVVLSKQSIETSPPTDAGIKAFWGIRENTPFYQIKQREQIMAVKTTLLHEKDPCPFIYIMIMKNDVPDELKKDVKDISETAIHGADGKNYYKIEFSTPQSEEYFVCEPDRNACTESLLNFGKWFYFCKESDSLVCDRTELIRNIIEKHDNIVKEAMLVKPLIGIWWKDSKLSWKLLKYAYGRLSAKNDSLEGMLTRLEMRKAVCRHPIEWDKNQFSKLDEKNFGKPTKKRLENEAAAIDLWNGGLDKIFSDSPYFYHPIYFINHLEKAGLFEFNPYAGMKYKDVYGFEGDASGINMDTVITGNPGFAPIYVETTHAKSPNINGYACITGFFNEDYSKNYKKDYNYYYHEGVDFRGPIDTEIHALTYGMVVDFGTHKNRRDTGTGMGDYMVVQDLQNINKYYVLVHLSNNSWEKYKIKKGTIVTPRTPVACVGTQEWAFQPHLHVSIVILNEGQEALPLKGSKKMPMIRNAEYRFPFWNDKYKSQIKNPFNHEEEWKGRL